MPLEAVAIKSLDVPIMRKPKHDGDLKERLANLYDSNNANRGELVNSKAVLDMFENTFKRGGLLYVGMFNDKPIAALGCFDDGQTDTKRLQYLAIHPENLNRGIEGRFIKLVYDAEVKKGVQHFMPVDKDVHRIMNEYELISVKR